MWERGQERFHIFTVACFSDLISSDSWHVLFLIPAPCNHYLFLAHMSTPSLQEKLTLGANNIKPHTMRGPKLHSYTSHNMIEEGPTSQPLTPTTLMLPLVARKDLFSFFVTSQSLCEQLLIFLLLSLGMLLKNRFICTVLIWSSSIYHLLSAVEPDCTFRNKFCLLPCEHEGNAERKASGAPLYIWDMICKGAGQTQQSPTLHHMPYTTAELVRSVQKEGTRRDTLLR